MGRVLGRLKRGLCIRCGLVKHRPGRQTCADCGKKAVEYVRRSQAKMLPLLRQESTKWKVKWAKWHAKSRQRTRAATPTQTIAVSIGRQFVYLAMVRAGEEAILRGRMVRLREVVERALEAYLAKK